MKSKFCVKKKVQHSTNYQYLYVVTMFDFCSGANMESVYQSLSVNLWMGAGEGGRCTGTVPGPVGEVFVWQSANVTVQSK